MKKPIYLIFVLAFTLITNAFGQKPSITLTFTAISNGQPVELDIIAIQNLTQAEDTVLYTPDNVLVLNYTLGMPYIDGTGKKTFSLSQNYPNPFEEETTVQLYLPAKDYLKIGVYNFLGEQVAYCENALSEGEYYFSFYPGKEKYYLLTVTGNNGTKAIKMAKLNSKGDDNCKIVFNGEEVSKPVIKSFQDINNFGFSLGDELKFVAYTALGEAIITDSPTGNESYEFQFVTGTPCPGISTVTYEGQTYNTVQIGNQCWFKENLNIGQMVTDFFEMTDNGIIEKYCFDNNLANCDVYGGLYRWKEMMQYVNTEGTKGICPTGWHIPSNADWAELTDFLGGFSVAGGKMKTTGTIGFGGLWVAPNESATNSSGFYALPGGLRNDFGFYSLGYAAFFWSSTLYSADLAWLLRLTHELGWADHYYYYEFYNGYSVRCLKD